MSWNFRMQISEEGLHRPPVAGIAGTAATGCPSLILSGGYEDDVDYVSLMSPLTSVPQDLVFKPVTTECKHNICLPCLKRSFDAETYSCSACRQAAGHLGCGCCDCCCGVVCGCCCPTLLLQGGAAEGPGEGGPREHGVPRGPQQGLPRLRGRPLGALLASTVVSAFPAFVSTYSAFVSVRSAVFSTCSLFVRTYSVFVTRQS